MTRLTIADLSPAERAYVHDEERRNQRLKDGALVAGFLILVLAMGLAFGDPGDRTQSACDSPAGVIASGSGPLTVEPDAVCSQEVGE